MNNETNTTTPHTLTDQQNEALAAVDTFLEATRTENVGNTLGALSAIKKHADNFKGSGNEPQRQLILSALVGIAVESAVKNIGVTNLAAGMTARYMGEPFTLDLTKAEKEAKEKEPTEMEQALQHFGEGEKIQVSKAIKNLAHEELAKFSAAVHSVFLYLISILSTKENPITLPAQNFLQMLFAVSGGSTEPFFISDVKIAEAQKVSTRTVIRGRDALIKWLEGTKIGIVDIVFDKANGGYSYAVNIVNASTELLAGYLQGKYTPDQLMIVASLAGKLLDDKNETLRKQLPPADFSAAQEMAKNIVGIAENFDAPTIVVSDAGAGAKTTATGKRLETLRESIGTALENANTLELADTVKALEGVAVQAQQAGVAFEKNATEPDFDGMDAILKTANEAIVTAGQSAKEKAQTAAANADTPAAAAAAYIDELPLQAQVEEELSTRLTRFENDVHVIAAIAQRAEDGQVAIDTFLSLQDTLNRAFGMGKYKEAA